MRFWLLVLLVLLPYPVRAADDALAAKVNGAVALLYSQDQSGTLNMHCTATAFEKTPTGYLFVSAAHCVGSDDTQHERSALGTNIPFYITFDETQAKTFYPATVQAVGYQHRGDDFSIYRVETKEVWTIVPLGDEKKEKAGSPILNIASPQGLGKQVFHGTISSMELDRPVVESDINWKGSLLLAINAGPGSSGSALVAEDQQAIIGFLVGTIGGNNIVGIPVSKFIKFRERLAAKTYKWYAPDVEDK